MWNSRFTILGSIGMLFLFLCESTAQNSLGISYQAVIRDDQGQLAQKISVSIRFSIIHDQVDGPVLYSEIQKIQTNSNGLCSTIIGSGDLISGDFDLIDWSKGPFYLKTEIDLKGGNHFTISGLSEMTAVPFAFHAHTAEYVDDADADPTNELQFLFYDEQTGELKIDQGNAITLPKVTGGDQWGSQVVVADSTLIGNGTTYDPLSVAHMPRESPWKTDSLNNLYYNQGSVSLSDSFSTLKILPQNLTFSNHDSLTTAQLNHYDLHFHTVDSLYWNYIGLDRYEINSPDYRLGIIANGLYAENKNEFSYFNLGIDSLTLFKRNHLSFPNRTTLSPYKLSLELLGTGLKSQIYPGSLSFNNDQYTSIMTPYQVELWDVTQSSEFKRFHASGDSLQLFNSTKWKTVDLQSNENKGGSLNLFNAVGSPLIRLGSIDQTGLGSRLFLYSSNVDQEKVNISASEDKGGEIILNGQDYTNFYAGGDLNRGIAYVANGFGTEGAGMMINHNEQGVLFTNGGRLSIRDELGNEHSGFDQDGLWMSSPDGPSVILSKSFDLNNAGIQYLFGENGLPNVYLGYGDITPLGSIGLLKLYDEAGNITASINGLGRIKAKSLFLENEHGKISHSIDYFEGGGVTSGFYNTNGDLTVSIIGGNDQGEASISLRNSNGHYAAGIYIDKQTGESHITANQKHFRIDHPTDSSKEIWYTSMEGPEAGIYERGTTRLHDGEIFVRFPEHFKLIFVPESATVQLTPKYWDTFGLAVINITAEGFYVKELKGGQGNFEFDWEIKAKRQGTEDFQVIRNKNNSSL